MRQPSRRAAARYAVLVLVVLAALACSPARELGPVDLVFDDVWAALDTAYAELGEPEPSWDTMNRVREAAAAKLADAWQQWPSGASYTMSVMDDHVVVWASCAGVERQDDWLP